MKKSEGQIALLLVLVVAVLGLGVGVSRINETKETTKESAYNVQTEQAYSCAEAGVDVALSCITNTLEAGGDPKSECLSSDFSPRQIQTCSYNYNIEPIVNNIEFSNIEKDDTEAIEVNPSLLGGAGITIKWKNNNTPGGSLLEVNLLKKGTPDYTIYQSLISCEFDSTQIGNTTVNYPNTPAIAIASNDGVFCTAVIAPSTMASTTYLQIVPRISNISSVVITSNSGSFPAQGFNITSEGTAGETKRSITASYYKPNPAKLINNTLYTSEVE